MKIFTFTSLLLGAAFVSALEFNTKVVKQEYNVGDTLEVSIVNNYDQDHWMVGIPATAISLYDVSGTTKIFSIQEMSQLKAFPNYGQSLTIAKWVIPEELETEYKIGETFSLEIDYQQSKRGTAKPISLNIHQPITIHGIRGTGSKALPPPQPRNQPTGWDDEEAPSAEANEPNAQAQYSATWAYNMIKALLVNHLM
ncbi:hypothetical protein K7432_013368 [Basidiobolus ranarum]|uniref:Uncharacterized protein n=1 Tax=Basidiobolus ranarum TaxID=34480 RepID=A0ABR2VRW0_9FUNG